jgi:hypothetical protein
MPRKAAGTGVLAELLNIEGLKALLAQASMRGQEAFAYAHAAARPAVAERFSGLLIHAREAPMVAYAAGVSAARRLQRLADAPIHPMLRSFANEVHSTFARIFAYGCAVAAIGLIVVQVVTATRGSAALEPTPKPEWVEVTKPHPAFALAMPGFDDEARYTIRRHADGGGRKDVLSFGDPAKGAFAEVEIYRPGTEASAFEVADADTVAGAELLRLSAKTPEVKTIASKFGPFVIADRTEEAGGTPRQCVTFTRGFDDPRMRIAGRYCSAGMEIVNPAIIDCALDRLSLVAAGSEPKVSALFARAELKRHFCGQKGPIMAATPKRNDWIEAARDPKLRGRQ